jgi:hypothetical protein
MLGKVIGLKWDAAFARGDEEAMGQHLNELYEEALRVLIKSRTKDQDVAEEALSRAKVRHLRVIRSKLLTWDGIVGYLVAILLGWKNSQGQHRPGVIKIVIAEKAREQRRREGLEFLEALPTAEIRYCIGREDVEAWRAFAQRIPQMCLRETLTATMDYVEQIDFECSLGSSKMEFAVAPPVLVYLKSRCQLKCAGPILRRLLLLGPVELEACEVGVFERVEMSRLRLGQMVDRLREKSKDLWDEPAMQQTLRGLADWFESKGTGAENGRIALDALILRKRKRFRIDEDFCRFLQEQMGISKQNTARKRFDRLRKVMPKTWLVEKEGSV